MKPLIIIGSGSHAEVVISLAKSLGRKVEGVVSLDLVAGELFCEVPILGGDESLSSYYPDAVELVNGVGSTDVPRVRSAIFERFKEEGFRFATLVDPTVIVSDRVLIKEGAQVMAGAILQVGCEIGRNVIVNTGVVLDHHCRVGNHSHLAPGVVCSGSVQIGDSCHLGTGATVIQGVSIEGQALVAAGAVVVKDVSYSQRVKGVPAQGF